jgi:hypothetical protein
MWTRENRILVRKEDQSAQATAFDLEHLIARRSLASEPADLYTGEEYGEPSHFRAFKKLPDGSNPPAEDYLSVSIRPQISLETNLDGALEREVYRCLSEASSHSIVLAERDSVYVEFRTQRSASYNERWRFHEYGELLYATEVIAPNGTAYISEIVYQYLSALRAARLIMERRQWYGRVVVQSALVLRDCPIEAGLPPEVSRPRVLGFPGADRVPAAPSSVHSDRLDHAELVRPARHVAAAFNRHLRTLRRAELEMSRFAESVNVMIGDPDGPVCTR